MSGSAILYRSWLPGAAVLLLLGIVSCAQREPIPDIRVFEEEGDPPEVELPSGSTPLHELLAAVEANGFGPVIGVKLENEGWEIDAYKNGERHEIIVDLHTGKLLTPELPEGTMPLSRILASLAENGYGPVLRVTLEPGGWQVEAYHEDRDVLLLVDPATGTIIQEE